jgi:hypothetical protein
MKTLLITIGLLLAVVVSAESKTRYFAADGSPLPAGKTGPLSLICETQSQWNDSGCPPNLILENGAVRLKTQAEKKADADKADQEAIIAVKSFKKLDIRRAFRSMGQEATLDALLDSSKTLKADWDDATEIDLSDPMVVSAIESANIDVNKIKMEIAKLKKK